MEITFELIVLIVCMVIYSAYAIWQMTRFEVLWTGICGAACLIAGCFAVYFAAPFIASLLSGLFKLFLTLIGIAFAGFIFTE